jgi:hypothetical protein
MKMKMKLSFSAWLRGCTLTQLWISAIHRTVEHTKAVITYKYQEIVALIKEKEH